MAPPTLLLSCLLVAVAVISSSPQPSAAFMIPCIPFLPKIPFLPCYQPPPLKEVTECWTPLMKMTVPCADFLTNANVTEPSPACCRGFDSVGGGGDGGAICYCHIGNGNVAKLLPAPMNSTRMFSLPVICNINIRLEPFAHCSPEKNGVPPITPPSTAPSSPSAP